ncbi:MAG: hypothetical protein ABW060_17600 [Solirubrobacteraceae bacterium]
MSGGTDLAAALVHGDADAVAAALARDPELVTREVPGTGRRTGLVRHTELAYAPSRPVRVAVRSRGGRVEIDDVGGAVAMAGRPRGWREAAERAVAALGWNVTRDGVVFVQAAADRDVDDLVRRTAEASLAVRDAILALEDNG